ncbi:hypothetical protein B0920_18865 [Massilia sp. KIM]|uniref:diguanylate cyclase n=1 Tax=Massilia sp. KIM TaxID=1955422 RepID=UPI00098F66D1|nr:diguanylate cyclase [Massilia sp. KIM]OON60998.1 hypothetical protein B0920_18865 [Massilia sp. KIM]
MFAKLDPSLKFFGALMLAIVIGLATLPFVSSRQAEATLDALKDVAAREQTYNEVLSLLKDAETGQRGFLLGDDESFLDPYNDGVAGLPLALNELARLATTDEERAEVARIAELSRARIAVIDQTIALKRAGDSEQAVAIVASRRGKLIMDEVRALLNDHLRTLAQRRAELRSELTASMHYNSALGVGASLACLVVIGAALFIAAHSLRERAEATKQAQLLAEANARHAASSLQRADRVAATAQMLQALDSVKSPAELGQVLPVFLRKLLPDTSGEVYLYRNSRDFLELKSHWGEREEREELVAPGDCWGLRLGKLHQTLEGDGLCCGHVHAGAHERHLCAPMISQGEVIGLLVIRSDGDVAEPLEGDAVVALAEQLGLGINNVMLRDTLRLQSTVDPLTGLYNRRHFDESLKRELVRAQRAGSACAVVMIDLDHFKRINDTYGHDVGDLVLKAAAHRITGRIRGSDLACRYGGEEIVLLLPDCSAEAAAECADTIRRTIGEIALHHHGQDVSGISASFGVAAWPVHAQHTEDLLKAADQALYAAKRGGRNQVMVAQPSGEKLVAVSGRSRAG